MIINKKNHIHTLLLRVLLGIFLSGTLAMAYFTPNVPPPPPLDPKLKKFPIDLDLLDFAKRNPFPTDHCFFPVKGRKDIVEFNPDEGEGMFLFPTGTCNLEEEKCILRERKGRLPGMKKTDPPVYAGGSELSYRGFAVIPYKYVDDIDFSKCGASWTGYFEADEYKVHLYKPPKRDYSKQSCFHPVRPIYAGEKQKTIFCDAEKCQLDEKQYCDHKTGQCYLNGYPLKTKNGQSVTTYKNYSAINWDFCLDETGALIPEDGGPPYEERFKAGCSYRITAPNYYEKQYAGDINFLIHCDENRCFHQELNFDMKKKEYLMSTNWEQQQYTKTPPFRDFLTTDWQCLDATKVRDYNKRLFCSPMSSDEKNPDCQLCYENKKFVYKGCRIPYDELGRRADIPESLRTFNLNNELEQMIAKIRLLKNNYEISWEISIWFEEVKSSMSGSYLGTDELERQRMAKIVAQFNKITDPTEKNIEKLKQQLMPFIKEWTQQMIENTLQRDREHMCNVCRSATKESRQKDPLYREACSVCDSR